MPHFVSPFIHWWTPGASDPGAVVNDASTNIHIQVLLCMSAFISFENIPKSGIVMLHEKCRFNFWKNCWIIFQSHGAFIPRSWVSEIKVEADKTLAQSLPLKDITIVARHWACISHLMSYREKLQNIPAVENRVPVTPQELLTQRNAVLYVSTARILTYKF